MNKLHNLKGKKFKLLIPSVVSIVMSVVAVITVLILREYTNIHPFNIRETFYIPMLIIGCIFGTFGLLVILLSKPSPTTIELLLAFFGVIIPIILMKCFVIHIY